MQNGSKEIRTAARMDKEQIWTEMDRKWTKMDRAAKKEIFCEKHLQNLGYLLCSSES